MWIRSFILLLFLFSGSWAFTLTACAGDALLTWEPPTTYTDGTILTNPGGYKVYYGTSSRVYEYVIDVGKVITWNVANLPDGRVFYFAVTAYDILGNESWFSDEVSKMIRNIPPGNINTSTPASVNRVDGYDLISLELSFGTTPASTKWNPVADIDGNGVIDQQDLDILIGNFGAVK